VHPEPTGTPGQLAVDMTFPTPGRYIINTEFRRDGQIADIHDRQIVTVAGSAPAAQPVAPGPRTVTIGGTRVALFGTPHVGTTTDLTFAVSDAATGAPIDTLQPYLAAAAHVVVMRADGATFAHEHADVRDGNGDPVFALPGTTFGPDLPVHVHFDTTGIYRLWAQFRLADGHVITAPFTITAR
jgi:Cu+-exporting ATPase